MIGFAKKKLLGWITRVMNDFVMMAIFVAVPVLGGLGVYLIVRDDEIDDGHKNTITESETDEL